jgi:alanine dehydrogenase
LVLILTKGDLQEVLTMEETIRVLEEAFKEQANGGVVAPDRTSFSFAEVDGWIGIMPAYIGSLKAFSTKFVSIYRKNLAIGLPTLMSTIILGDPKTGEVKSIMDGSFITAMRTGGLGGLAAKYLSREDAHTVGIFGAGIQARTQLIALDEVRKIEKVTVYDPVTSRAESFSQEMSDRINAPVKVSTNSADIVRNSEIVVTVSTSKDPVFDGKEILPGTHINAFGNFKPDERELDSQTVKRSKIIVDQRRAALAEAGDLLIPIREGTITENDILADFGEIVTGRKSGRTSASDITLFKSVGLAIQDCAASALAFSSASKKGIGTEVDLRS